MDPSAESGRSHPLNLPNRYAYFRDGDLYLLGVSILPKEDPALKSFIAREQSRAKNEDAYVPFIDRGPPLKDGKYDQEFLKTFGLKIPEKMYFVLGDNHAMSSDSRIFGFVPEDNLQGVPVLNLWPQFGPPPQTPYPTFVPPRIIVWILAAIGCLIWYGVHRFRQSRPLDLSQI